MTPRQEQVLRDSEDDFQEFVSLARAGVEATSSDVEHAAWRLAQAVIDDAVRLPRSAIQGFSMFTAIAYAEPTVAQNLFDP